MDRLDVHIIRALYQPQPVPPFGPVATRTFEIVSKQLGISRETVRARVNRLHSSGVLLNPKLHLNPNIVGMHAWALGFDVPNQTPESKRQIVSLLRSIENTLLVFNFVGSFVGMMFYCGDENSLKSKMELIKRISQMQNPVLSEILFPPCELKLSVTDWRIISVLKNDIGATYVGIAKQLKISPRTVKRRISKLNDSVAVYAMLSGDNTKLVDATEVTLHVFHTSNEERGDADREILRITDDYTFFAGLFDTYSHFGMFLPSAHKSREILETVKNVKGVKEARIYIVDERFEMMDVLASQIEKKLSQLGLSESTQQVDVDRRIEFVQSGK